MIELDKNNVYSVLIVGCGGTGSQLIPFLMQLYNNCKNIKEVILVDGDIYEPHNQANQKCISTDMTINKAKVLANRYNLVFPELNVSYIDEYITDDKILKKLSYDNELIIVGCVDNIASRKIIDNFFQSYSGYKDLIYIDSGNGTDDRKGQVITGCKIRGKKVLNSVGDIISEIHSNVDDINTVGTCMRISKDNPQNIATNVLAATTIFTLLTNIFTFNKIEANLIYFNADTHSMIAR